MQMTDVQMYRCTDTQGEITFHINHIYLFKFKVPWYQESTQSNRAKMHNAQCAHMPENIVYQKNLLTFFLKQNLFWPKFLLAKICGSNREE